MPSLLDQYTSFNPSQSSLQPMPMAQTAARQPMPMVQTAARQPMPMAQAAARQPISQPEMSPFWHGYRNSVWGPGAAELHRQRQLSPWRQKVITTLGQELLEGRPQDKPITSAELIGVLTEIAPQMLTDARGMKQLNAWASMWNKEVGARVATRRQTFEDERTAAGNLYKSGSDLGAAFAPGQRALMGRHGYATMTPGAGMATAPGIGLIPGPAPMGQAMPGGQGVPATQPKRGGKQTLFSGFLPGPGQREAQKIVATTPAETARTLATGMASQRAQLAGHQATRLFDQKNPAGGYYTHTDPATGIKTKKWSGSAPQVDLGRSPESVGDIRAQVVQKALTAAASGQDPNAALNETERQVFDNTLKNMQLGDIFALMATLNKGNKSTASDVPIPQLRQPPVSSGGGAVTQKVGDVITFQGKSYRISAIKDGRAIMDPVQ